MRQKCATQRGARSHVAPAVAADAVTAELQELLALNGIH
jgi:hypothetical protein